MNVLALQHDIVWEDKPANHAVVERMLAKARPAPGDLVVLAELFDTGFSMNLERIVDGATVPWARRVAVDLDVNVLCGHAERAEDSKGRNRATLVDRNGRDIGWYDKIHPFSFGRESTFYGGGQRLLLRRVEDAVVCPLICYDLRFPELWRIAAFAGAEVFLIGASWPATRQAHWRALCIARAIENQAYVVAVNRVGSDPFLPYTGGSIVVSPRGEVVAEADDRAATLRAALDLAALRAWRAEFPALRDLRREHLGTIVVDSGIT